MKRPTGIILTVILFAVSAAFGWKTGSPEAKSFARRSRIPVLPSTGGAAVKGAPDAEIARLEKILLGNDADGGRKFSSGALDQFHRGDSESVREYLKAWAERDPAAAFAWLQSRGAVPGVFGGAGDMEKAAAVFDVWARKDLEAALASAPLLTCPAARAQALFGVLQMLWKTDAARALLFCEQNLELFAQAKGLKAFLTDGDSGRESLGFLKSLPPGKGRARLLASVLKEAGSSSHPGAAVSFWKAAPGELHREIVSGGFSILRSSPYYSGRSEPDFTGAEDLLRARAESTGDRQDVVAFLSTYGPVWACRDLPAALAWTQEHFDVKQGWGPTVELFRAACTGNDFEMVVRTWNSFPASAQKARLAGIILEAANSSRKEEVRTLIRTLSPGQQQIALKIAGSSADK